jgi:flagellar assembly protein FliH
MSHPAAAFDFDQLAPGPRVGSAVPGGPSPEEVSRALDAARGDGFQAGHAAGIAEAEARIVGAEQALHAAAAALEADRAAMADRVERSAVELSLRIAEQVIRSAVAANPDVVLDAVQGALRALVERERVLVLVNPDDLEIVRAGLGALTDELGGVGSWEVQAERRVTRGGAVVRTADGEVDASLEAKIARAREALDDELRSA